MREIDGEKGDCGICKLKDQKFVDLDAQGTLSQNAFCAAFTSGGDYSNLRDHALNSVKIAGYINEQNSAGIYPTVEYGFSQDDCRHQDAKP